MDGVDVEPAIAEAMGFSGFGTQPNYKKRRYNVETDAVIDGEAVNPTQSVSNTSSGANVTKLGVRQRTDSGPIYVDEEVVVTPSLQPKPSTKYSKASQTPAASAGLAAFLSQGQIERLPLPNQLVPTTSTTASQQALPVHAPLPQTPPLPGVLAIPRKLGELTREDLRALRQGVRNERGDMAYFLPSFVEDPWKDVREEG
ncbi:hypothetical protein LTR66_006755 [Elasticomyces elasticus]|nr:hypothetical protein LTR66_006755 [Elasticomyces elasticus]KAK4991472.1 hypothetical protein LTR50_001864 [Elasticomyces elasticus]